MPSFWERTAAAGLGGQRFVADNQTRVALAALQGGGTLDIDIEACRDRCVLIRAARQLPAVLALAQLDGVARRIVLCPPDVSPALLPAMIAEAGADIVLTDGAAADRIAGSYRCGTTITPAAPRPARGRETEWLLFTSGTTGRPKMVVHTLASLAGPLQDGAAPRGGAVWSTFYDVRRYGGLQILLRAFLGGGAMVLSEAAEPVSSFLLRAGGAGVTHISGTPSHWRRALMSGSAGAMAPDYVRLSGEIADQAILNHLGQAYPAASIAHAFASTEAGVGFEVRDGLAGFPASLLDAAGQVEMRVQDGSLRLRSARTAARYAHLAGPIADADGFVDTGDLVERRDGRYYFVGRREGIINVGGQKVHPEEVEAVVNLHPDVRMCRVHARRSPITGALVVADLVLRPASAPFAAVRDEVLATCRRILPVHKVPALLREVAALDLTAAGKLLRAVA